MVDGWYTQEELACLVEALKTALHETEEGGIAEVGVYRGKSARALARNAQGRRLLLFDNLSTEGADTEHWPDGEYHLCDPGGVEHIVPLAFLHHDADHSPDVVLLHLRLLGPLVVPGGIVALHDFHKTPQYGVSTAWNTWEGADEFNKFDCRGSLACFQRKK